MALKDIFSNLKKEGYVVPKIDLYLSKLSGSDADRALDVNAPSQAGNCLRANFYARTACQDDGSIAPRTQRVFDNGTHVHLRLQKYMSDMGLLICDEVPILNDEYKIQGHTDGFLDLGDEVAILEIKSINDNQFGQLKDAKEEHKKQGLVYLYCAEERRKYLHKKYKSREEFFNSEQERRNYFAKYYQYMQDGHKFKREEKIQYQVDLNIVSDDILYDTEKPITKVIFLYEDKNNQELKEFVVDRNSGESEAILKDILNRYSVINECCRTGKAPEREGTSKSCNVCRWCNYKNTCWIV